MEPAKVEVPLTVKLELPADFVMLLPVTMDKLAIVCVACRSNIEVPVITTPVELDSAPVSVSVPALMVVLPV